MDMKLSSSDLTRKKLMNAATEIFSEVGYGKTTIRAIVQRAHVNQAAVNYHFKGKDALYLEVIRNAFNQFHEVEDEVGDNISSKEDRLKMVIEDLLNPPEGKTFPEQQFRKLLAWEMIDPTGLIEQIETEGPIKCHMKVMNVIRPFLPNNTPEYQVAWAAFWLIAQCSMLRQAHKIIPLLPADLSASLDKTKPFLVNMIMLLALSGFKNMPIEIENE